MKLNEIDKEDEFFNQLADTNYRNPELMVKVFSTIKHLNTNTYSFAAIRYFEDCGFVQVDKYGNEHKNERGDSIVKAFSASYEKPVLMFYNKEEKHVYSIIVDNNNNINYFKYKGEFV